MHKTRPGADAINPCTTSRSTATSLTTVGGMFWEGVSAGESIPLQLGSGSSRVPDRAARQPAVWDHFIRRYRENRFVQVVDTEFSVSATTPPCGRVDAVARGNGEFALCFAGFRRLPIWIERVLQAKTRVLCMGEYRTL